MSQLSDGGVSIPPFSGSWGRKQCFKDISLQFWSAAEEIGLAFLGFSCFLKTVLALLSLPRRLTELIGRLCVNCVAPFAPGTPHEVSEVLVFILALKTGKLNGNHASPKSAALQFPNAPLIPQSSQSAAAPWALWCR